MSGSKSKEREKESRSVETENEDVSIEHGAEPISNIQPFRKVLGSFLLLAWAGCGYSALVTFPDPLAYFYVSLGAIFTAVITWILLDLQRHHETDSTEEEDGETDGEKRHFLCANPLCKRCAGYYGGLGATTGTSLRLHDELVTAFEQVGVTPWPAIFLGFGIFTLTTPIHGAIKTMMRAFLPNPHFKKGLKSDRVKLLLGLVSGLSLSIAVIGALMILPA